MNDNKKKVLTDEELQEVSGGFDYNESMKKLFNDMSSTYGSSNSGFNVSGSGGLGTSSSCISFSKESCEKNPKCYWSSDGTCRYRVI